MKGWLTHCCCPQFMMTHETCSTCSTWSQIEKKNGIIQTSRVVAVIGLKDPPTWLKVATTLEPPTPPTWAVQILYLICIYSVRTKDLYRAVIFLVIHIGICPYHHPFILDEIEFWKSVFKNNSPFFFTNAMKSHFSVLVSVWQTVRLE